MKRPATSQTPRPAPRTLAPAELAHVAGGWFIPYGWFPRPSTSSGGISEAMI